MPSERDTSSASKFSKPSFFPGLLLAFLFIFPLLFLSACGGSLSTGGTGSNSGGGSGANGGSGGGGGNGGGGITSGAFTAGRTKYVRTDATTEYFGWINPHWAIYNPVTNFFYVTDPSSNRVIVLDASSETQVGIIKVPAPYTIDDTADHRTLYIASGIGDIYTADPISLNVLTRYPASQIGPSGFPASTALVMADGSLALLHGNGGVGLDGSAYAAFWNISTNSITLIACATASLGSVMRTPDRTKLIVTSVAGGGFCEVDEPTMQFRTFGPGGLPSVNSRITPDGKYIVVPFNTATLAPNQYAYVYDLSTLNLVSQIPVNGETSTAAGFAISADSKTLFVPNDWAIYAYDLASGQPVGWVPNIIVPNTSGGGAWGTVVNPNMQAADGTGLLVGPLEEGVGFIDSTTLRTGPVGSLFTSEYATPATGPISGNIQVKITEPTDFSSLSAIYFGSVGSPNISGVSGPNSYGNFGSVTATAPAHNAGWVDLYVFTADGGMQLLPEAFSYGPTVVQVTPSMSTAEGGGTGIVYGYGFGPVGNGVGGPLPQVRGMSNAAVPSSLTVSVGGSQAPVTAFAAYAYSTQSPPFPLQAFAYTIPPGNGPTDITITTSSGSVTAKAALTYLPATQQFSLSGAALAEGIYDPHTDLYYFTDTNKLQVFSRTLGSWQAPINVPPAKVGAQRLWALALSPDGTKLAISDAMGKAIYVLDPANPSSIRTFPIKPIPGAVTNPSGLAISDKGMVYYAVVEQGISGARQFFKLNTNTGAILDYGIQGPNMPQDTYLRALISTDNSRVFFNELGFVFYIDTATDTVVPASIYTPCCYLGLGNYDMAFSSDQSHFAASNYLYDFNLEGRSFYALNDREGMNIAYLYGTKYSADGALLFQPTTLGIDVLDGRLGNLLSRISLPVPLSSTYDTLVADGTDNVLVAITGANGDGIAVIDLTSIPGPPPLPYSDKSSSISSVLSRSASMPSIPRLDLKSLPRALGRSAPYFNTTAVPNEPRPHSSVPLVPATR